MFCFSCLLGVLVAPDFGTVQPRRNMLIVSQLAVPLLLLEECSYLGFWV